MVSKFTLAVFTFCILSLGFLNVNIKDDILNCDVKNVFKVESFSDHYCIYGYNTQEDLVCQDIYSKNKCGEKKVFQGWKPDKIKFITREKFGEEDIYKAWVFDEDFDYIIPNLDSSHNSILLDLNSDLILQSGKISPIDTYPIIAWAVSEKNQNISIIKINRDQSVSKFSPNLQEGVKIKDIVFSKVDSSTTLIANLKDEVLNDQYVFIFKLNSNGEKLWEKHIGNVENEDEAIFINHYQDSLLIAGSLSNHVPRLLLINTKGETLIDTLFNKKEMHKLKCTDFFFISNQNNECDFLIETDSLLFIKSLQL